MKQNQYFNPFFNKRISGLVIIGLCVGILSLAFGLKDFYFQYTVGEVVQFSTHFNKRVVQVKGTVFRSTIPGTTDGGETNFILVDDLTTPLSVRYKGDISPLLKSGEKVLVEGEMDGALFIAQKVKR